MALGEGMAKPRPNPRKKVAGNRGFGAEPAGAFDYANRGVERYAVARSNTKDESNRLTGGYAIAPPPANVLKRYALLLHSYGLPHCTSRASLQFWHKQSLIHPHCHIGCICLEIQIFFKGFDIFFKCLAPLSCYLTDGSGFLADKSLFHSDISGI